MATTEEITSNLSDRLEARCIECGGRGSIKDNYGWHQCEKCAGQGYIPTDEGNEVLDFVRRHLHIPRA